MRARRWIERALRHGDFWIGAKLLFRRAQTIRQRLVTHDWLLRDASGPYQRPALLRTDRPPAYEERAVRRSSGPLLLRNSGNCGRARDRRAGYGRRRDRRRRRKRDGRRRGRAAAGRHGSGRARLLQRVEVDEREIVREHGAELVLLRLRQVALGLNHEKARRHPDFQPLTLGVEPLLGELAGGAGRVDALRVHVDLPRRVANLLDGARLGALQPLLGLRMFELGPRRVRLLDALPDRIGHADAERPCRKVAPEQLVEHVSESDRVAGSDDGAWEAAAAQHLRAAEAVGLVARVEPDVWQLLTVRVLHAHLRVVDLLARARQVGALAQAARHGRVDVDRDRRNWRRVDRLDLHVPGLALGGVVDQQPQPILDLLHRRLGDDQLLLVRRHFRLR